MRPTRFYSKKQETKVAKFLGGKRTANSGATKFMKGDVLTEHFLVECKTCTEPRNSFTIHKDWFDKIEEEAFAMDKDYSVLVFDFGDGHNRYVIDENLFKAVMDYIERED